MRRQNSDVGQRARWLKVACSLRGYSIKGIAKLLEQSAARCLVARKGVREAELEATDEKTAIHCVHW